VGRVGAALGSVLACEQFCSSVQYYAYKQRMYRRNFSYTFMFSVCQVGVGFSGGCLCHRLKGLVRRGSKGLGLALTPCGGVAALIAPPTVCPALRWAGALPHHLVE